MKHNTLSLLYLCLKIVEIYIKWDQYWIGIVKGSFAKE